MHAIRNSDDVVPPVGASYSHAIEVAAGARWLVLAGQVGMRPDGSIAEGFAAQADQAWQNVVAVLRSAGMGLEDVVRVTMYVTSAEYVGTLREVRARYQVDGYRPASTLVVVQGLAMPQLLVEIEVTAAKLDG